MTDVDDFEAGFQAGYRKAQEDLDGESAGKADRRHTTEGSTHMPDLTITAKGAVARQLRVEALSSLSVAAHELDHATDHRDEPGAEDALDKARAAVRQADALVEQIGYAGDDALELTAGASEIAALANEALGTLAYHLEEGDKSSAALREAATVAEALEGFVAQATSAQREPVEA